MKPQTARNRGFINGLVVIVVTLIILGYFNINLKTIASTPAVKDNLSFAWQLIVSSVKNTYHVVHMFTSSKKTQLPQEQY